MANELRKIAKIKVKRGLINNFPTLDEGEPGLALDAKRIFFGTGTGNLELANKTDLDALDNRVNKKADKDTNHETGSYKLPEEDTIIYRVERKKEDNVPYTVMEIVAPKQDNPTDSEATLTLMRETDEESGGAEFLDLFNNGYGDSRKMGVRVQTRGGELRDFVFEFSTGQSIHEVFRVRQQSMVARKNMIFVSNGWSTIDFESDEGKRGNFGAAPDRITMYNAKTDASFAMYNNGYTQFYSPIGSFHFYLDDGSVYVNDHKVQTTQNGDSSMRPADPALGECFFDGELNKPIWYNGGDWVDAMGTSV